MEIYVPEYSQKQSFPFVWEDNFAIKCEIGAYGDVCIKANRDGLISLARHLLVLAQEDVPEHTCFRLDGFNALEVAQGGVSELTVVKQEV